MGIRILNVNEIEKLNSCAISFFQLSEFLNNFDMDYFEKQWTVFINSGVGVLIAYEKDREIIGCLGGVKFNDPNNGKLMASELFWFVLPEHRGVGIRLLRKFEEWAKKEGCTNITMCYLMDSMPDVVKKIYEKKGYKAMEVHYIKEVL